MSHSNLFQRVLFAFWAIPLGWWVINSQLSLIPSGAAETVFKEPGLIFLPGHLLIIVLTFLAVYEYISMLSLRYSHNGFWLVYFWVFFQLASHFMPTPFTLSRSFDTYILLMIVALEAAVWGKKEGRWKRASLLFSGIVFLSIAGISMLNFYKAPLQDIFPRQFASPMLSQMGIIVVCAAVFMCDSMAYFAGKSFGKHHFSTISPKKTTEGGYAGLAAAIIVSLIGWYFFASDRYHIVWGVIMGVLIGVFAQLGDLLVSLIKRYFRVKDASNIIPGHGGILDRFDSLFFTAPILNLFFILIDKL